MALIHGKYVVPDGYTSDIAVFTITEQTELKLLLIQRAWKNREGEPNVEAGKWALPGGFVDATNGETALQAAERELYEEAGIRDVFLKHYAVYDQVDRDPRGWMVSNAHYAIVPEHKLMMRRAADDAQDVQLFTLHDVFQLELAFDHERIIREAISFIERDLLQTTLAREFLPAEFTIRELQRVLLTVTNDYAIAEDAAFFRKVPKLKFIEMVTDENGKPKKTQRNSKSPAKLYRFTTYDEVKSIY